MMSFFNYCPNCGSTHFEFPENRRFFCHNCEFVYFHNIAAAVAVIFRYENQMLFTVRNIDPDKGKLDLPGGFIDPKETAEEAACREIKEEMGIDVKPNELRYITTHPNDYPYKNVPYRTMDIFFECKLQSDQVSVIAKDEIQELIWVKTNAVELDKIGFTSIRNVVAHYVKTA